jgi:IclR helix-turn-helix domain
MAMAELSTARERSKLLFGTEHMLTVTSYICDADPILTVASVCEATGVSQTTVHRLVNTLAAVGVLIRLPRNDGDRSQWYSRCEHPFWPAVRVLAGDEASSRPRSHKHAVPSRAGTRSASPRDMTPTSVPAASPHSEDLTP